MAISANLDISVASVNGKALTLIAYRQMPVMFMEPGQVTAEDPELLADLKRDQKEFWRNTRPLFRVNVSHTVCRTLIKPVFGFCDGSSGQHLHVIVWNHKRKNAHVAIIPQGSLYDWVIENDVPHAYIGVGQ